MASAPSSARRSTRASQPPLSLAEEQAASTLSQLEQRDIATALRLSLHDSWDSDEERSGAGSDAEADSSLCPLPTPHRVYYIFHFCMRLQIYTLVSE